MPDATHQRSFFADVELVELRQGKVSAHVTVQNKEAFGVAGTNLVSEVVDSTGSAELDKLLEITDVHGILVLHLI